MTSKSFKTKCLMAVATCLVANQCFAWGLSGGFATSKMDAKEYDGVQVDANGVTGSILFGDFDSQLAPALNATYQKGDANVQGPVPVVDNYGKLESNYFEGTATIGYLLMNPNNLTVRLTMGLGLALADLKLKHPTQGTISSNATFAVLPVGLEVNYLVPNTNLSFFGSSTYKYLLDVSEARARCVDGTSSSTSGYRACDGHGGISFESDFISGDLKGWQFAIGGRLYF